MFDEIRQLRAGKGGIFCWLVLWQLIWQLVAPVAQWASELCKGMKETLDCSSQLCKRGYSVSLKALQGREVGNLRQLSWAVRKGILYSGSGLCKVRRWETLLSCISLGESDNYIRRHIGQTFKFNLGGKCLARGVSRLKSLLLRRQLCKKEDTHYPAVQERGYYTLHQWEWYKTPARHTNSILANALQVKRRRLFSV